MATKGIGMDWADYQPGGMDIGHRISCNWRMYVAEFTGWMARMTCGRMGQALGVFLTGMEEGTRTGWMDIGGVIRSKVCALVRYLRKSRQALERVFSHGGYAPGLWSNPGTLDPRR